MATANIDTLYKSHNSWLKVWLGKRLDCSETAADLAHDTFVRLMVSRHITVPIDESRALLTHIAKGLVVDHWRRQSVEQAYLETIAQLPECEAPSVESRYLIVEALYRIDAMLRELPELTRNIFLLSQLDNLKYRQIAEQQGVSLPTVKRHMRRAFLACLQLDS